MASLMHVGGDKYRLVMGDHGAVSPRQAKTKTSFPLDVTQKSITILYCRVSTTPRTTNGARGGNTCVERARRTRRGSGVSVNSTQATSDEKSEVI